MNSNQTKGATRLNAKDLQQELKISQATYYRMVKEGMPYTTKGKVKFFDLQEVQNWIVARQSADGISDLKIGQTYKNDEIAMIFKCSTQGGMRRSHATNTLVLFTDHSNTSAVYEDKWIDNVLHYTGMGLEGDQDLEAAQNKTLSESPNTSIRVFLFETLSPTNHTYLGEVKLIDQPYFVEEKDQNGTLRQVIKFPLATVQNFHLQQKELTLNSEAKERKVKSLSVEEIAKKAQQASNAAMLFGKHLDKKSPKRSPVRRAITDVYDRSPHIARYVKQLAAGHCQLCEKPAPFKDASGTPFLECHHIHWLSEGGLDTIENTIALCSNCHRKMHILNLEEDVKKLKNIAKQYPTI